MARDFISIDTTQTAATEAVLLKTTISIMRQAYEHLARVKAKMGHLNDGSTFTDIEAKFGLPAGKGQAVFDFVNGSLGSTEGVFQVSDFKDMTEQLG